MRLNPSPAIARTSLLLHTSNKFKIYTPTMYTTPTAITAVIVTILLLPVRAQYSDFYATLEKALFSGSSQGNPGPSRTLFENVAQSQGSSQFSRPPATPAPQQRNEDPFGFSNINSWDSIPSSLFGPAPPPSRNTPGHSPLSGHTPSPSRSNDNNAAVWGGVPFSVSDNSPQWNVAAPLEWDYSSTGLSAGGQTGVDAGGVDGGGQNAEGGMFLPLADHSPGSPMIDQPFNIDSWSAPPISEDTAKYKEEPTPKPKPAFADGKSMAEAILRGQARKWEWKYGTTLGTSSGHGEEYYGSMSCCQRLPYICGVDGMCVIEFSECESFCSCAANPKASHCLNVIPVIVRRMKELEKKMIERVAKELNITTLPPDPTTVMTTTTTTTTPRPLPLLRAPQVSRFLGTPSPISLRPNVGAQQVSKAPVTTINKPAATPPPTITQRPAKEMTSRKTTPPQTITQRPAKEMTMGRTTPPSTITQRPAREMTSRKTTPPTTIPQLPAKEMTIRRTTTTPRPTTTSTTTTMARTTPSKTTTTMTTTTTSKTSTTTTTTAPVTTTETTTTPQQTTTSNTPSPHTQPATMSTTATSVFTTSGKLITVPLVESIHSSTTARPSSTTTTVDYTAPNTTMETATITVTTTTTTTTTTPSPPTSTTFKYLSTVENIIYNSTNSGRAASSKTGIHSIGIATDTESTSPGTTHGTIIPTTNTRSESSSKEQPFQISEKPSTTQPLTTNMNSTTTQRPLHTQTISTPKTFAISTSSLLPTTNFPQPVNPTDLGQWFAGGNDFLPFSTSKNATDLFDADRENKLIRWFNMDARFSAENGTEAVGTSPKPQTGWNTTAVGLEEKDEPCSDKCEEKGGACVMGNDFKPHCVVVADDACDHFHCINGECVSTDGLYMCECEEGWMGTFCDQPCTLDCGEHGYCWRVSDNDTIGCVCHWNYTGSRCDEKRKIIPPITEIVVTDDGLKAWEVAVVAAITAISLALISVLLPYILWRRQWLPIRKLVFYFQEYEDDDDKEYDAFISYKSTPRDERFILQHLYPKLEKELDFRLCLHFRDFPPGEPIANNIIHAIESSRRTILVLSPSYVSSEWCRMEYQKAQHEMLKLKHKIIPIVLEDISGMPEVDKNLKTIIDTVTYINWPGEEEPSSSKKHSRFWKLLELSMPKKKSEYNTSISSSGSTSSDVQLTAVSKTCFNSIASSLTEEDILSSSSGGSSCGSEKNASIPTSKYSSIGKLRFPEVSSTYPMGHLQTISLTPPLNARIQMKDGLISSAENTDTDLTTGSGSLSSEITTSDNRSSPLSCQDHGYVSGGASNVLESKKMADNAAPCTKKPFLTSDNHIVEIRDAGHGNIKVTPRPRRQYYV